MIEILSIGWAELRGAVRSVLPAYLRYSGHQGPHTMFGIVFLIEPHWPAMIPWPGKVNRAATQHIAKANSVRR
jgi:hypothetical protein